MVAGARNEPGATGVRNRRWLTAGKELTRPDRLMGSTLRLAGSLVKAMDLTPTVGASRATRTGNRGSPECERASTTRCVANGCSCNSERGILRRMKHGSNLWLTQCRHG